MDYKPNQRVLDQLTAVHFVAVVGPSASGKSTLIKQAVAADATLHMIRNNTSREPRPEEVGGTEFYFRTRDEMLKRIDRGEYVQIAPTVLGDLYATAPEDFSTTGIAMLPVLSAAVPTFRQLPFASFKVVYVLPPDVQTWLTRLAHRSFTKEKLRKRLAEADQSLAFALNTPKQDVAFIINKDLDTATGEFIQVVKHGAPGVDPAQARQIAKALQRAIQDMH